MPTVNPLITLWKKYGNYVKSAVAVITVIVSVTGWIISTTTTKVNYQNKINAFQEQITTLNTTVDALSKQQSTQFDKINDALLQQNLLNGKVLQYIQYKQPKK